MFEKPLFFEFYEVSFPNKTIIYVILSPNGESVRVVRGSLKKDFFESYRGIMKWAHPKDSLPEVKKVSSEEFYALAEGMLAFKRWKPWDLGICP